MASNSASNTSKMAVPQAKEAMNRLPFRMEMWYNKKFYAISDIHALPGKGRAE